MKNLVILAFAALSLFTGAAQAQTTVSEYLANNTNTFQILIFEGDFSVLHCKEGLLRDVIVQHPLPQYAQKGGFQYIYGNTLINFDVEVLANNKARFSTNAGQDPVGDGRMFKGIFGADLWNLEGTWPTMFLGPTHSQATPHILITINPMRSCAKWTANQ